MKTTLELGVFEAVSYFNKGNIVRCEVVNSLGIDPGMNYVKVMKRLDQTRIQKADKAVNEIEKQCLQHSNFAKRTLEVAYKEEEWKANPLYGAAMH